jgi:hypothetical protein
VALAFQRQMRHRRTTSLKALGCQSHHQVAAKRRKEEEEGEEGEEGEEEEAKEVSSMTLPGFWTHRMENKCLGISFLLIFLYILYFLYFIIIFNYLYFF